VENTRKTENRKNWKDGFEEEWTNVNPLLGVTNENAYPTFSTDKKISSKTPATINEIGLDNLKKQYQLKQKYKGNKNLPDFVPKKSAGKKGSGLKADTFRQLLESSYAGGDVGDFKNG